MSYEDLLRDLQASSDASEMRRDVTQQALGAAIQGRLENATISHNRVGSSDRKSPAGSQPVSSRLSAFLKAEGAQESGGNYSATNPSGAVGKYQILKSNFIGPGGWDQETIGRDVSLKAYMNHPRIQENIAQGKLTDYFKAYGAAGAAKAWYAGPGNATTNSDAPQYGGPSINDYAQAVVDRMKHYLKNGRKVR